MKRPRVDINMEQLDVIVEATRARTLEDQERGALKTALHAMAERLAPQARNSEKSRDVLASPEPAPEPAGAKKEPKPGHGRNGADAFTGATRVAVPHPTLHAGCTCPGCQKGKLLQMKRGPAPRIRFTGQAPVAATIHELERLRCGLCGEVFTADAPEEVGDDKYDESVTSIIGLLKYGRGIPFNRIEAIQQQVGVPLPSTTQWDLVKEGAELMKPILAELCHLAAQADVMHGDDTGVKILNVEREVDDERTGLHTTSIVAGPGAGDTGPRIALFVSGTQHAGENLADLLEGRAADLGRPIVMTDALAANASKVNGIVLTDDESNDGGTAQARPMKLSEGVEVLLANCLTHGRRQVVEVTDAFPQECRLFLEELGKVYGYDREARHLGLDPKQRLQFHKQHSGPVMKNLREWMTSQLDEKRVEPNSRLGKAYKYLLTHWNKLTLFLKHPGAPLDNNLAERAIKKVVLHRKNALFYRTVNGAHVGDLYMSIIHTCELNGANAFEYMTILQKHAPDARKSPSAWLPWNYQAALARPPD
jgi:transposase